MFTSPAETFQIGNFSLHYYGLTMGLGMLVGILVANKIAQKFYPEIKKEIIFDIAPAIILGAIIGARVYYCLLSLNYYINSPIEALQIWQGGLSIHGGILGGLIAGIIYAKRNNLPILKLCDIFSYGLCIGQAIGRWGNFFNSEAFGKPTNCFCKLFIPVYARPAKYLNYSFFHPTFLYESICDILIFLILFFVIKKIIFEAKSNPKDKKSYDGVIFFSYLILYSIVRILIEQVRIDSVLNICQIPVAQLVSALIIIISTIFLIFLLKKKPLN